MSQLLGFTVFGLQAGRFREASRWGCIVNEGSIELMCHCDLLFATDLIHLRTCSADNRLCISSELFIMSHFVHVRQERTQTIVVLVTLSGGDPRTTKEEVHAVCWIGGGTDLSSYSIG